MSEIIEHAKPHFCLYCGDDPRFEIYPHPSFGSLGVSVDDLTFEPNAWSIYFPDTGAKPTTLRWPKSAISAIALAERMVDFDHLYSEYGSEVEELSNDAGIRDFNVPLPVLHISANDPGGVITEGLQLVFAFGTVYRARSFGTKLASVFELSFDPAQRGK